MKKKMILSISMLFSMAIAGKVMAGNNSAKGLSMLISGSIEAVDDVKNHKDKKSK